MPSAVMDRGRPFGYAFPGAQIVAAVAAVGFALFFVPRDAFAQASPAGANANPAQKTEQSLARGALAERQIGKSAADLKHGELIATGKAACHAGQVCGCFQCHGVKGEGNPAAGFPRIGAQSYLYLDASLQNFASGRRVNAIMQPIARQLSPAEMQDVAAYYASLKPPIASERAAAAISNSDPALLSEGGVLAAIGSAKEGVQACQNCHGPAGAGLPPIYPSLAAQYAAYIEGQMQDFRSGKRQGDAFEIMQDIARRLSERQIKAVAAYYASIVPEHTVTQSKLGPAVQVGAPLEPEPVAPSTSGGGQNR